MKRYDLETPEGTGDLLFEESQTLWELKRRLGKFFSGRGYSEVVTSTLEYYDVFSSKKRRFEPESLYKLFDGRGRVLVLRPDCTLPIARLAATRLKDEPLPLKLFYTQNIFWVNPRDTARDDETTQSGIEIIGGEEKLADYEAVAISLGALKQSVGASGPAGENIRFRLELGDCRIANGLVRRLGLSSEEEVNQVRELVRRKNSAALSGYGVLSALTGMFGGEEVFAEASKILDDEGRGALGYLKTVFEFARDFAAENCPEIEITVDLGMVGNEYYTGLMWNACAGNFGKAVLSGGRYDNLVDEFVGKDCEKSELAEANAERQGVGHPDENDNKLQKSAAICLIKNKVYRGGKAVKRATLGGGKAVKRATLGGIGFAVNLNYLTSALAAAGAASRVPPSEVLVFAKDASNAAAAFARAEKLNAGGTTAEVCLFSDEAAAEEYARAKNIKKIEIL